MISVLIPVYNVENYILRCLESVAGQTYQGELECVIVDDCGKDRSIDIARDFIERNNSHVKFRIVRHDHNRGLAAARNTGIDCACGEFVMHLDSDDWLEPDAIKLLAEKQQTTDADIVSGNALAHYADREEMFYEPDYGSSMDMVRRTIQLTLDHVIWRRLIRKSLYIDNDIRAEEGVNIGEDHHTLPRLAYHAGNIAKVDSVVYHYNCMNPASYMQMSKGKINMPRYRNDSRSIRILRDFFTGKDSDTVAELDRIMADFERNMRATAVAAGDSGCYAILCKEQGVSPHYLTSRFRYFISRCHGLTKIVFNKLFG